MTKTKQKLNKNIKLMIQPIILLNSCPGLNPSNPNGNIMVRGKVKTPYLKNPNAFFVGFISINPEAFLVGFISTSNCTKRLVLSECYFPARFGM